MGWLPQSRFDELKRAAEALTPAQRVSLTWEEAVRFVAPDTLELAAWGGMSRRKDMSPWEAVARLRRISDSGVV